MFEWNGWALPILGSALALGFYDICKKHAVRDNSVMPVLFFATLCGSAVFVGTSFLTGTLREFAGCSWAVWWMLLAKSALVASSWTCVYYAMRELPISLAAPIRASSPVWTFLGSLVIFNEIPSWMQALGMAAIFAGYYLFSVLGKMEGISFTRHKGVRLIFIGTLLGATSALYDKYLLHGGAIPRGTVQFWFSVDLVLLLGAAYAVRQFCFGQKRPFEWRWSIPLVGILLIAADWLYFYAVSMPEIQISILSLVRRCSCIVTFAVGSFYFHDRNLRNKAFALLLIILGVMLLALVK